MSKWDTLHRIDGLYVGMLDADELELFDSACKRNEASRCYDHAGGIMGLAKVRLVRPRPVAELSPPGDK
ncbi:hypothetical protein LPB73_07345 [Tardiphaga sp. 37S4]|uniref:hypothetical protein n=1 Tax=Tardiphaga sp. 37S4 TaxID=1404741 RepID=UPI001E5B7550|nr:hypothetical protein [Tardiphaga sp. 37S4]UFS77183.1 hypothetical protein LPB73_07345 [Tardiphaga sp. 37S4]